MSDLYLGAYWGPRRENVGQCADHLTSFLHGLRDCNETFDQWFEKGKSRKNSLASPFDFRSREETFQLLESGRSKRDLDQSTIDDLGFRVSLWNGRTATRSSTISISCGIYADNPHLRNSVVIDFPDDVDCLADKDQCFQVLKCVAETWQPDWAGVISRTSRKARPFNPTVPFVDWMVYVNQIGMFSSKLPVTATTVELEGKGTVVIVQDHPIDPTNPTDLLNVKAVSAALNLTAGDT